MQIEIDIPLKIAKKGMQKECKRNVLFLLRSLPFWGFTNSLNFWKEWAVFRSFSCATIQFWRKGYDYKYPFNGNWNKTLFLAILSSSLMFDRICLSCIPWKSSNDDSQSKSSEQDSIYWQLESNKHPLEKYVVCPRTGKKPNFLSFLLVFAFHPLDLCWRVPLGFIQR